MHKGYPRPDRAVVINLERRPDRLADFTRAWSQSGWNQLFGMPETFNAVDGTLAIGAPRDPGVYGCRASHINVLGQALADGVQSLAVFEDDAVPQPDSAHWLKGVLADLPKDAVGLWLDASSPGDDNCVMRAGMGSSRLTHPPMLTHAYLVLPAAMEPLLQAARSHAGHVDWAYATVVMPGLYAATPSLATQSASKSDIRVLRSDGPRRRMGWH